MNKQIVVAIAFFLLGLSLAFAQTNSTTTENDDARIAASSVEYDYDTSAGSSLAPLAAALLSALF
jgi:hypothetical protein